MSMSTITTSSVSLRVCKSPRGPIAGAIVVDLFCKDGWSPIAAVLEAVGFDYRQAGNAFKVYGGGATLFHQTSISPTIAGRPFVRRQDERIGQWLDRCSADASGIGIEIVITRISPSEIARLLEIAPKSTKYDYEEETEEWLSWYQINQSQYQPIATAIVEVVEPTASLPTDHSIDLSAMTVKQLKELWESKAPKTWGAFPRSARKPIEVLLETLI